jgi:aspartate racemase
MKNIGVIGGLGPDTTAEFYKMVIRRSRRRFQKAYPRILIHSIPLPFAIERNIVRYERGEEEMYPYLVEGLKRLETCGADYLAIPCNTVHLFYPRLVKEIEKPLLNILDETAEVCRAHGFAKVGILGTGKTIEKRLYQDALEKLGIEPVLPEEEGDGGKDALSALIYRILEGKMGAAERSEMAGIASGLEKRGAEAIILGCTDLQHLVCGEAAVYRGDPAVSMDEESSPLPLVDSLESLAKAVVRDME